MNKIKDLFKKPNHTILRIFYLILPLIAYYFWNLFITINGQTAWNDWNFSATANKGSLYTIINNLLTFNFLNQYAYQNWEQLFLLNFNWILWLILVSGATIFIVNNFKSVKKLLKAGEQGIRTIIIVVLFSLLYFFTVLSFQTYTIPRYALPILCLSIIGISWTIAKFINILNLQLKTVFIALFTSLILLRLFYSVDPVSISLWGKTDILNQSLYALNSHLAGNDGITYNMQYNLIVKTRSDKIKNARNYVISNQCNWIFPDPNNDYKTIMILKLKLNNRFPCL